MSCTRLATDVECGWHVTRSLTNHTFIGLISDLHSFAYYQTIHIIHTIDEELRGHPFR